MIKSLCAPLVGLAWHVCKDVSASIIADGSHKPAYVARPGLVTVAKLTGRPVVPKIFAAERKKPSNLDRALLPAALTRITIVFGKLIVVQKRSVGTELENELKRVIDMTNTFI